MSTDERVVRVLHVEDDPDFASLTATVLERDDDAFAVETATDPEEGVALIDERSYDCVVSDYDMPGMNGIELLTEIRSEHPHLPVILFTGKGSEEIASEAIAAGVTDYLQKGMGNDQYAILANRIRNAVEGDKTRRKLKERNDELRRYKHMVNSMGEAACVYSPDGRFEIVNEYLADWYGTTREELEGRSSNLIPKIQQTTDGDPVRSLLDGRKDEIAGEVEGEFPGHGHAVLEYRLTPLRVSDDIEGVVGVSRDVTDRIHRERELKRRTEELEELTAELEEQYRYLFEEAPVMAVVTRAENGIPIVDDCNQRFVDRLGYEKADVLDRELAEFYTPTSARELLGEGGYERALSGEFVREDRELVTADGGHVETLLRAVPRRDAREDIVGTLALFVDISERKELEREKARLEEFTSVVSHDLRNPLNVAHGRAELAQEACDSEHLSVAISALERMDELIENLLTLARSGENVTEVESIGIEEISHHAWQTVETETATLRVDTDRTIRADRIRVQQLFENLFRNAIEHGEASIAITIGELDGGFYVEDTGPGVPEDDRGRIFDAGYSTKNETGFGLSIVKQVCEAHGWEIRVTDGANGGARFEVTGVEFGS